MTIIDDRCLFWLSSLTERPVVRDIDVFVRLLDVPSTQSTSLQMLPIYVCYFSCVGLMVLTVILLTRIQVAG